MPQNNANNSRAVSVELEVDTLVAAVKKHCKLRHVSITDEDEAQAALNLLTGVLSETPQITTSVHDCAYACSGGGGFSSMTVRIKPITDVATSDFLAAVRQFQEALDDD